MEENKNIEEGPEAGGIRQKAESNEQLVETSLDPIPSDLNPQPLNEMEVHHHSNHGGKKNWKSYFWEFLMLFLAVFCGFLAEYQLEHKIEKDREKQFVQSLKEDIKLDTATLLVILKSRDVRELRLDSFTLLLNSQNAEDHGRNIYFFAAIATRGIGTRFIYNDGTIQQLKNAGGLRLVRKQVVVDAILKYDASVRALVRQGETEEDLFDDYRKTSSKIFNGLILEKMLDKNNALSRPDGNPALLNTGQENLDQLNYWIYSLKTINKANRRDGKSLIEKALSLLHILNKEYHLQ